MRPCAWRRGLEALWLPAAVQHLSMLNADAGAAGRSLCPGPVQGSGEAAGPRAVGCVLY